MLGFFLAALGVAVFLLTVAVAVFSLPTTVLTIGVVLAVVAILVVGLAVTRRAFVVRLEDGGYRIRFIRGAGVMQARWRDVEDVVATTVAGERCIVIRLRDGGTTTLPVRALAGDTDTFVRDLQEHLNQGHGYRRIN